MAITHTTRHFDYTVVHTNEATTPIGTLYCGINNNCNYYNKITCSPKLNNTYMCMLYILHKRIIKFFTKTVFKDTFFL